MTYEARTTYFTMQTGAIVIYIYIFFLSFFYLGPQQI